MKCEGRIPCMVQRTVVAVGLWAALSAWAAQPEVTRVGYERPSEAWRFYHFAVELSPSDVAYDVAEVTVDGRPEMFVALVDGQLTQWEDNGRVARTQNGRIPADKPAVLRVRCPWVNDHSYALRIACKRRDNGAPFNVTYMPEAYANGGFPFPGWKEHRIMVLREDFSLAREHDPYLFFLSDDVARVNSWARELRVARYNPATGETTEIPSQVLYEKKQYDTPKLESAYATCQAAILVDVPANGRAWYLIAYGNSEAETPNYATDLSVREEADGSAWVENDTYAIQIHGPSGQLHGFRSKVFGTGERRDFGFMKDRGYTLHYNPDAWVKNRDWTHTHGWNPPPHETLVKGPVAVVTRRWGHLPRAAEIEVQVTYHFFSKNPYVLVESTMDILEDVVVTALRNEEVVFSPSSEVDHAGWKRPNGEVGYKAMTQEAGMTPGMVAILEPDAPYVCLTREANGLGMASLRLSQHAGSRSGMPPVVASTKTIVADYGWDFRYWSRSLVYPWGEYIPDKPAVLNAGTYYGERSAFCLFPLGDGDTPEARLAWLEPLYERLSKPLTLDEQGAGPW